GGIFTITVTVRDNDGGQATRTTTAVVTGVGLVNGVLYVVGTDGRDSVQIDQVKVKGNQVLRVTAQLGSARSATYDFDPSTVRSIVVLAGGGNDTVSITRAVNIGAIVLGGAGR